MLGYAGGSRKWERVTRISHAIIRGENGRRHEVHFGDDLGLMVPHTYRCTYGRSKATITCLQPGTFRTGGP